MNSFKHETREQKYEKAKTNIKYFVGCLLFLFLLDQIKSNITNK